MVKKSKKKSTFLRFSKLSLSFLLIYLVFTKVDPEKVIDHISSSNYMYIVLAFLFVAIAQIYGGLRMRYYLGKSGYIFSKFYSVCFYYLGTFFNAFIPGGVGGDGYKAYYFQKEFRVPWKTTIIAIISGRLSALFFISLSFLLLALTYQKQMQYPNLELIVLFALAVIFPLYSFSAKKLLKESVKTQIGAFKYSFPVQISYILGNAFVLLSIEDADRIIAYLALFQLANIVAIIPISVGGLGLRELTFISLAEYFGLSSDIGVASSLMFYLVYIIVSLLGVVPYIKIDQLNEREKSEFKSRNTGDKPKNADDFKEKFDI